MKQKQLSACLNTSSHMDCEKNHWSILLGLVTLTRPRLWKHEPCWRNYFYTTAPIEHKIPPLSQWIPLTQGVKSIYLTKKKLNVLRYLNPTSLHGTRKTWPISIFIIILNWKRSFYKQKEPIFFNFSFWLANSRYPLNCQEQSSNISTLMLSTTT